MTRRALTTRRPLRRRLARLALRLAGVLDGRALALREDLGALVRAVEQHAAACPDTRRGPGIPLAWHLDEARRSMAAYDRGRRS